MNKLFLDASYAIALGSPHDRYHTAATKLATRIGAERIPVLTTRAVLLEIGNEFSKRLRRSSALALLGAIAGNPYVEVTPLSDELYERGLRFF